VDRIFEKSVYLKVDFPHHPGKIVMRKLAELEGKVAPKKKEKKPKAKKGGAKEIKAQAKEEKPEEEKA